MEKLTKKQLRTRMNAALVTIGFFSAVTVFTATMAVISFLA